MSTTRKDHTGRNVAVIGGGALLLLLLLRGKGWGLGGSGGKASGSGGNGTGASDSPAPEAGRTAPCQVRIDADGIELDGAPTDLPTMTARCRAAGSAEVRATGAAITGVVADVIQRLEDAGVTVWAASDLWSTAATMPRRKA